MLRIVVIGTSGAGKTTLARRLAAEFGLPHIELDALNWQPGWRDLTRHDPDEFIRRVAAATEAAEWVADGNYGPVRDLIWRRATHLVWLDYGRPIIMVRVIRRSLLRLVLGTELWGGNRERWRRLLRPSHPIRWAWATWARRRRETAERLGRPEFAHLAVLRLRRPRESAGVTVFLLQCSSESASVVETFTENPMSTKKPDQNPFAEETRKPGAGHHPGHHERAIVLDKDDTIPDPPPRRHSEEGASGTAATPRKPEKS